MEDVAKFLFGISAMSSPCFYSFLRCLLSGGSFGTDRRRTSPGAVQHDPPQLPPFRLVRSAVRVAEQHPGVDDQRRGRGDRDGVRGGLPVLRVQQEGEAPDAGPGVGRGGGVRGRGAGVHARPARGGLQAALRRRHDSLLHLHVRLAALHQRLVIKTKSVEYMPLLLSLAVFLCGTSWFVYGLLGRDPFVTIPNGCGSFLGAMQLILYAVYRNNKGGAGAGKMQGDDVEMSGDARNNNKVADSHHEGAAAASPSTKASKMDSQSQV